MWFDGHARVRDIVTEFSYATEALEWAGVDADRYADLTLSMACALSGVELESVITALDDVSDMPTSERDHQFLEDARWFDELSDWEDDVAA